MSDLDVYTEYDSNTEGYPSPDGYQYNPNEFGVVHPPNQSWWDFMSTAVNPGVYIIWERRSTSPVAFYQILRGATIDSEFETIATLPFPAYDFVDTYGNPSHYYRIREISPTNTVLSTSEPIFGSELLIKATLMYEVQHLMRLHVESEDGIFEHKNRNSCRFVHSMWNSYPRPEIRITSASNDGDGEPFAHLDDIEPIFKTINGDTNNYPDGLRIRPDYNGRIFFIDQNGNPTNVQPYDTVTASYDTRAFTQSQMNNALNMALQGINAQPGSNKYPTVGSTPIWYDQALISGAAYFLLRSLSVQLNNREFKLLITDPDDKEVFARIREQAKQYQEDYNAQLKVLPISLYPRSRTIVTPEYFLPGGRSRFFRYLFKGGF